MDASIDLRTPPEPPADDLVPIRQPQKQGRRLAWTPRDFALVALLLVLAASLRFVRLGIPPTIMFDENYYARDACLYAGLGQATCGSPQATEQSWVHPQVGKWLISVGITWFGYDAFGWRAMAATFGTALVLVVYLLARILFRDRWIAAVAGLLVATDFLLLVESRIAMLDIFLAFFAALGFLFLALDREEVTGARDGADPLRRRHRWRFAAGVAFGLAVSVKWSAAWPLAGGVVLAVTWSLGLVVAAWRRAGREGARGPVARLALREAGLLVLALAVVPAAVYVAGYAMWFAENGLDLGAFAGLHQRMLDYHLTLKATHSYQSEAWTWPLVLRPVAYYWQGEPSATHIVATGNPATWWACLPAGVWLLLRSARRGAAERAAAAGWASQYLPWLIVSRPLFFFYMTPVVPFMMLALAAGLAAFRELGTWARAMVTAYLVLGVGIMLWYLYPVIAAVGLPMDAWRARMILRSWI